MKISLGISGYLPKIKCRWQCLYMAVSVPTKNQDIHEEKNKTMIKKYFWKTVDTPSMEQIFRNLYFHQKLYIKPNNIKRTTSAIKT